MLADPLRVAARVAGALDALGIDYVVGGSLASSLFGVPRSTQDVDFVANVKEEHVDRLTSVLRGDFYVDADMIREAIQRRATFNIVHLATMFKADVFVPSFDSWIREELSRGRRVRVGEGDDAVEIRFATAEDVILHKLLWFRLGGESSERQWDDVLGVLRVQAGRLDDGYIGRWADALGLVGLWRRARSAAAGT